ncbi:uncharacterized protein TNCV_114571 [Trichonephila clavipes]|nr:uncharacterized protein TNCV_114571 [Trichonephila clavipes]
MEEPGDRTRCKALGANDGSVTSALMVVRSLHLCGPVISKGFPLIPSDVWKKKSPGRDLIRERMVGKLEKGHSLTSVAEEFGINKRAFSSVWEACQTISKAVRNIVAGHLRKTTA